MSLGPLSAPWTLEDASADGALALVKQLIKAGRFNSNSLRGFLNPGPFRPKGLLYRCFFIDVTGLGGRTFTHAYDSPGYSPERILCNAAMTSALL
jgi:hypothetical protein